MINDLELSNNLSDEYEIDLNEFKDLKTEFELKIRPEYMPNEPRSVKDWISKYMIEPISPKSDHSPKKVEITKLESVIIPEVKCDLQMEVKNFMSSNRVLNNKFVTKLLSIVSQDFKNGTLEKSIISLCESDCADTFDRLVNSVEAMEIFEKSESILVLNPKINIDDIESYLDNIELLLNCQTLLLALHLNQNASASHSISEQWLTKVLGDLRTQFEFTIIGYKSYTDPRFSDSKIQCQFYRIVSCFSNVLRTLDSLSQIIMIGEQQVISIVYLCNFIICQPKQNDEILNTNAIDSAAYELLISVRIIN